MARDGSLAYSPSERLQLYGMRANNSFKADGYAAA
jgi:hypothetical protein